MRGMTAALGFRLETDRRLETRDTARHRLRNGDLLCLLFGCGTTHHALATLVSQPKVVDPGSRNLVADQQNAQAMDQPDDSATSVITASELQTYFARLSQESDDDTKGSSNE